MEERKRQLSLLLLMVMLVAVNALTGGPWIPSLPSLSPDTVRMIPYICLGVIGLLGLYLFICTSNEWDREEMEALLEKERAYQQRRRILERKQEIATNPNAPPETLKEQIERKKLGL